MSLAFFAKTPFLRENKQANSGRYLQRASSIIRAQEIAKFTGGTYNKASHAPNDVRIFVKPSSLENVREGDYVDVLDDLKLTELLKLRPGIHVIAMSGPHYDWLKQELSNTIVLIPHHHVNFERIKRTRKKIQVCGYIGTFREHHIKINNDLARRLKEIDMEMIQLYDFKKRQDTLDFYSRIDIQIIGHIRHISHVPQYHATKIINAMSFGIPTVSGYKLGYRDVEGYYLKGRTLGELVKQVVQLKDQSYYNNWVTKILPIAERYHIENIAKIYTSL